MPLKIILIVSPPWRAICNSSPSLFSISINTFWWTKICCYHWSALNGIPSSFYCCCVNCFASSTSCEWHTWSWLKRHCEAFSAFVLALNQGNFFSLEVIQALCNSESHFCSWVVAKNPKTCRKWSSPCQSCRGSQASQSYGLKPVGHKVSAVTFLLFFFSLS